MTRARRMILALLCWTVAGAAGWWWHRPTDPAPMPSTAGAQAVAASAPLEVVSPMEMANQIGAADAMALKSVAPAAATAPSSSAPSSTDIVWRLAALVVRDAERYAVLTTSGQPALRLRVGEDLPDGDKIKAIHADRIDIKSPRGRVRTLYLIEP